MDLILWRHAEAVEAEDGAADLVRALTPKGERQAHRMGRWLERHLPAGTRVLASPSERTLQTAKALDRKFKVCPELAPEGTVEALLQVARWPDAREPVLVVGHQSALGMAAAYLLHGAVEPMAIRKGGFVWLSSRERGGATKVVLHAALSPELL